jgi:ubiquinone/menaquinone biosynthesis C-methylase UbiE
MFVRLLTSINRVPGLRRRFWRHWYQYLSARFPNHDWTYMNYGFEPPPGTERLRLRPEDEPDRFWNQLYHHVADGVDLTGRSVLEVGSGRGGGASFVARYHAPATLVGLDVSTRAVAFCRQRHHAAGLSFQQGDAEALPFPANELDAVLNVESSHCYGSLPTFLAEVWRVLRPGGHFLYADFRTNETIAAWTGQLRAAGFREHCRHDITDSVLRAMTEDGERRLHLVQSLVPRFLRPAFHQFAGLSGSVVQEEFRARRLTYLSFVLEKPRDPAP